MKAKPLQLDALTPQLKNQYAGALVLEQMFPEFMNYPIKFKNLYFQMPMLFLWLF